MRTSKPKNRNFSKILSFVLPTLFIALLPVLVFAADPTLATIISKLRDLVNQLVAFVIGLAVLVFLWGLLKYVTAGADGKKIEEARNFMIFGIIGIFVMFSVWGLVNLLVTSFGLTNTKPTVPTF